MRSGVNRMINSPEDGEGDNDKREEIGGKWKGKGFKELFTDGSYKSIHTVKRILPFFSSIAYSYFYFN